MELSGGVFYAKEIFRGVSYVCGGGVFLGIIIKPIRNSIKTISTES